MPFYMTKVYGRSGKELHDRWAQEGAPSAYAGMAVPDCPNFCLSIDEIPGKAIADRCRYDYRPKYALRSLFSNDHHVNTSHSLPNRICPYPF